MSESQFVYYDQTILFECHQNQFIFSRGFIDDDLHLSLTQSVECQFKFEQKNYQIEQKKEAHSRQVVVFGTEILIKHVFSDFYVAFALDDDGNDRILLRKEPNESCYFELIPQRSFQHKGDAITTNSSFSILHSATKSYLGSNIFEVDPLRNKMRLQQKGSLDRQSYHLTRQISASNLTSHIDQIDRMLHHLQEAKQTQQRKMPIQQQLRNMPNIKRAFSFNNQNEMLAKKQYYLPINIGKNAREGLMPCLIEKHAHTMWRAHKKESISTTYLQDNDYIYFVSSFKNKGTMVVQPKEDRRLFDLQFISKQGQTEYECSAIFIVQIQKSEQRHREHSIYLKHLITGKYFPFTEQNVKKRLKLVPLLPTNSYQNKLPPFHIYFDGQFFPREFQDYQNTCGFWLNKVDKIEINQILSLQSMPYNKWITYLIDCLDQDRLKKQELLKQFGFLRYIVYNVVKELKSNKDLFMLLFKMINQNKNIRKQMASYVGELVKNQRKELLIDIFSEVFNNNDSLVEKYIQSDHLLHEITDFKIEDTYSITYMRIFRLFCGHYMEPCKRNQNVIYGLFFGSSQGIASERAMTQSYLKIDSTKIADKYKFKFSFKENEMKVQNCEKCLQFKQFPTEIQQYIRQYFYLLGDCLKQNKLKIEQFKKSHGYKIDDLMNILQNKQYEELQGPIINLINVAYLDPQYKYKLYVYIKDYDQMCYNGSLVALQRNDSIRRLLEFINQEKDRYRQIIDNLDLMKTKEKMMKEQKNHSTELQMLINQANTEIIKEFASTKFKRFLIMIKHTIENGYWDSISKLEIVVDTLSSLYRSKEEKKLNSHEDYSQVHQWKNYMDSTVLIIDIAILYLDIQINLCISNLITIKEDKVAREIQDFVKSLEKNKEFQNRFDYFQLTDPENQELMKKSLILSRKYYQIKSIIRNKYLEDILELRSSISLKESIEFIKQSIEDLKLNNIVSISKCKEYIEKCMEGVSIEDLSSGQLLKNGHILRPAFSYRRIVSEFQVLASKLGVIQILADSLERYINLRIKQKQIEQESIYWKTLLLYILLKDNQAIKKQIIPFRISLIYLVAEDNLTSFVALDVLEEIYANNRSIIVSDREEIRQICRIFVALMKNDNPCDYLKKNQHNVKINKLVYLIHSFLIVNGKKIKNIFPLVLNELYDKEVLVTYIRKLKYIQSIQLSKTYSKEQQKQKGQEAYDNYLFQILLYRLTETLQQKPQKMNFTLPRIEHILNLILRIGKKNLKLTFDIYCLISEHQISGSSQLFIAYFSKTLRQICQLTYEEFRGQPAITKKTFSQYSDQIKTIIIYFPILIKIARIILVSNTSSNNQFQPLSPQKLGDISRSKIEILERLFLFNHYLEPRVKEKLMDLATDSLNAVFKEESFIEKLEALDFQGININDLKNSEISLTELNDKKRPQISRLKRLDSKIVIRGSKNEGILEMVGILNEYMQTRNNSDFKIQDAKAFISSLTCINKRDQSHLDPQLKTFFLGFLINRFPKEPREEDERDRYQIELEEFQNLLVEYGSGELVSSILEEKFKENYPMFINLFEYANKLLQGGNQSAQNSFYDIFLKDHKNITFENIKIIIQNSTLGLKFYYHSYPKMNHSKSTLYEEIIYPDNRGMEAMREKQNFGIILKRIYRFLQLLCENDNQLLKNYIYKQINQDKAVKYMSVNFLEIAINNFSQLIQIIKYNLDYEWPEEDYGVNKDIVDDLLDVLVYILDFLIEVCQYPAFKNQVFICNTDFFDCIDQLNQIVASYTAINEENKTLLTIQRKIVILLRGLLEQKNTTIIGSLKKKLNIEGLMLFVKSSLDAKDIKTKQQYNQVMSGNHDKLVEEIQNVVDILIVTSTLGVKLEEKMSSHYEILDQIRKQIRQIQVDFRGNLTTISFCYRPIFNYLSKDTKQYFINEFSKHESRGQKLKDIINMRHVINQDILQRKSRKLIMSQNATNALFHFSISLCFLLVALELFFFSVNKMGIALDNIEHSIIHGLSLMQFLTSLVYFALWGINISPITIEKIKGRHNKIKKKQDIQWKTTFKNSYVLLKQIYLEQRSSLHAVILLFLSTVACFLEIRVYSIALLYIFAKIQLLRDILSAISVTWRQLALVSLLSLAFNFIFGMMSINNYISVLYQNESIDIDIDQLTSHCSTIMSCMDSLYAQRIIGQTPSRVGDSSHYGRLFSDAIYWAFFQIVIPNLCAAIIIDKFAELRNLKEKMQREQRNRCLICYADKSTIQKTGQNFDWHKLHRHCIWDYFFYLYYLEKLKSNTEYTGVQYWIVEQIKKEKIEWFPIHQSQKNNSEDHLNEELFQQFKKIIAAEAKNTKDLVDQ